MPRKLTQEEYENKILNKTGIKCLGEYKGAKEKIKHLCVCGNEYMISPNNAYKGYKCQKCRVPHNKRKSTTIDKLKEKLLNTGVILIGTYKDMNTPTLFGCICGNEYITKPSNAIRSTCGCSRKRPYIDTDKYKKALIDKGIKALPIEDYKGSKEKIKHLCGCGNEYMISPNDVLRGVTCGCSKIQAGMKRRISKEMYMKKYNDMPEPKPKIITEFISGAERMNFQCVCSNEFSAHPVSILKGKLCRDCGYRNRVSSKHDTKHATYLYFFEYKGLYKIGITKKTKNINYSLRMRYSKSIESELNLIFYKEYPNGSEAHAKEQELISKYKDYRYIGESILPSGNTELFVKNIITGEYK